MEDTSRIRQRLAATLTSWPFLICVLVLLANDWWWKASYPGVITGKLSDFSGIGVVTLFFLALHPHRTRLVCAFVAVAFLWWKSPASQPFIQLVNFHAPFNIGRVVDYTDLIALLVLPIWVRIASHETRFNIPASSIKNILVVPAAVISLIAVMGTSLIVTRQEYVIRPTEGELSPPRAEVAAAIREVVEKHGLKCVECSAPMHSARFSSELVKLTYSFTDYGTVQFEIDASHTMFGPKGERDADALNRSLKAVFSERFVGLEYVEPLRNPRFSR